MNILQAYRGTPATETPGKSQFPDPSGLGKIVEAAEEFRRIFPSLVQIVRADPEARLLIDEQVGNGLAAMYLTGLAPEADRLMRSYFEAIVPGYSPSLKAA